MTEFKVGDEVVSVKTGSGILKIGDRGTVVEVKYNGSDGFIYVKWINGRMKGETHGYYSMRFELAKVGIVHSF